MLLDIYHSVMYFSEVNHSGTIYLTNKLYYLNIKINTHSFIRLTFVTRLLFVYIDYLSSYTAIH